MQPWVELEALKVDQATETTAASRTLYWAAYHGNIDKVRVSNRFFEPGLVGD